MNISRGRAAKVAVGTVAALVLAGGGAAVAATVLDSPATPEGAIITDAAGQLGVQPSALSSALTKAIDDQINAEVTAGQITQAQASALEARIAAGQLPLFGGSQDGFGRLGGAAGDLSAAATYLGLSASQIRTDLQNGQTLAQIADGTSGKSSSGLIQALVSAAESKLSSAVSAGKLSSGQEQSIESNLQQQITNLVNGTRPATSPPGGFGPGPGRGGFGPGFGVGGGLWADLGAAETYLGLTAAQIMSDLQKGQTLAQIADATSGKSSSGLIQALVSAAESKLSSAVSAGKLSSSQEQSIESNLQQQITSVVNQARPAGPGGGFGGGGRFGGGPGPGFRRGGFGPPGGGSSSSQTSTGTIS